MSQRDLRQPIPVDESIGDDVAPMESVAVADRQLGGKLAGLTLPQQVFVLAVWPFLDQVLNFLVTFVDTSLAGHLSKEAAAAITVGAYFMWLIGLVQMAVGTGATAVIARAIGGKHKRLANAAVGQAMILALVVGCSMGLLVFSLAPSLAWMLGLKGQSLEHGVTYLRILASAAPLSAILFIATACLRGAGDTQSPFYVMIAVNVVNVGLSLSLVWQFDMGVDGIATGTLVAWAVGAVLIVGVLVSGVGGIRLRWPRLRPRWSTMQRIVNIGVPSLLESSGIWLGNIMVIAIVGSMQSDAVLGAHGMAIRVEGISYLPAFAMGIAAATLAGQYLGLGDPQRAREAVVLCWKVGAGLMTFMGLLFLTIPDLLTRMVTNDPELLAITPTLLRICAPVQLFFGTYIVLSQAMRGAGDTRATMLLSYSSTYLVRLPAAYLLCIVFDYGIYGVWIALSGELVVRGIIFCLRFLHGGWVRARV